MGDKEIRPGAWPREGESPNCRIYGKDSEITPIPQTRYGQLKIIEEYLGDTSTDGHTRMQVSRHTGIERASVCRRVPVLKKKGKIWSCGKRLDPITGCRAEYLTTNPRVALRHFTGICIPVLEYKDVETQLKLMEAIKLYAVEGHSEIDAFGMDAGEAREIWETQVKPLIDRELK